MTETAPYPAASTPPAFRLARGRLRRGGPGRVRGRVGAGRGIAWRVFRHGGDVSGHDRGVARLVVHAQAVHAPATIPGAGRGSAAVRDRDCADCPQDQAADLRGVVRASDRDGCMGELGLATVAWRRAARSGRADCLFRRNWGGVRADAGERVKWEHARRPALAMDADRGGDVSRAEASIGRPDHRSNGATNRASAW